jgi:hypothetical protein
MIRDHGQSQENPRQFAPNDQRQKAGANTPKWESHLERTQ